MQPRVTLIVAWSRRRVIGQAGALPWHLPEDLRRFKATTLGHPIVMGRKTWEAIGRPLPGRRSIVVTRDRGWHAVGCETAYSLAQALDLCRASPEVFVIGGAELFEHALPLAQRMIVTEIDADFAGDTFFPPFDAPRWRETAREHLEPSPARPFAIDFITLEAAGPAHSTQESRPHAT